MNDLPSRWVVATGGDLFDFVTSGSRGWARYYSPTGAKFIRIGNLQRQSIVLDLEDVQSVSLPSTVEGQRTRLQAGDILVSITAELGLVGLVGEGLGEAYVNQHIALVRPSFNEFTPYVVRYLISPEGQASIGAANRGVTRAGLGLDDIRALGVRLPPLAEQRRIVAKIDSLSAKSKRARDQLDHVRRLVEKYKQAILAAAFRGEITREWRLHHADRETPEDRLEKLRAERNVIGKKSTRREGQQGDNGRIPVTLEGLPSSWTTATLEDVSHPTRVIQYGILKPGPDIDDGVPYVKVMNIKGGRVHLDGIRRTTPEIAHQYRRASIVVGDILLTIRGTVGRLAIVPKELDGGNITQDTVRIAVLNSVERDFVFWYLHCPVAQQYFSVNQKGVAVRGINVGDVRPLEVPLPPRSEQQEIVRRVVRALAWIDRLASEATSARKLIDHLDQAILSKAFQGKLVPQDPSDEPASVSLERIRAERQRAATEAAERSLSKRKEAC
jgi:type I restriction enzyme, S subunit